jgi:parallel beta-helix repeat protein
MRSKIFVVIMTLVTILSSIIIPVNINIQASGGDQTLYVGGAGEGNFSKIQDAIDNASSGDTVFVYENTYYENIVIDVSINLIGEDKENTMLNENNNDITITITADWVNLSGFTIKNNGNNEDDAGIKIHSNYTNISNNIIKDCDTLGIILENAHHNTIFNNIFQNYINISTILLWNTSSYNTILKNNITNCVGAINIGKGSHNNNITENNIDNNTIGIYLWKNTTSNNLIFRNSIINTTYNGILIEEATSNKIYENQFEKNGIGIRIIGQNPSNKNMIYHNNFINNTIQSYDECNQTWDNNYPSGGNYWNDYTDNDLLSGSNQNNSGSDGLGDTPYYITVNTTQDRYPLIYPWGQYSPVAEYDYSIQSKTASFNASDSYDCDNTIVSYEWDFGDSNNSTGKTTSHTYSTDGGYNVTLTIENNEEINDTIIKYIYIGNDTILPEITNVSSDPTCVGFGFNITINATVTDNISGVKTVKVNITYPDNTYGNHTMNKTTNNVYSYVFSDTWQNDQYNYSIWTVDYKGNTNISTNHSFNVSAQATISIATLKDSYGDNENINITDPPTPPSDYYLVGRGSTWNEYYNASSGRNIREFYTAPINYQDEDGTWTPIEYDISLLDSDHPAYSYGYRAGNEQGLYNVYYKPDSQSSWPVAFAYNKSTSPDSHVIRSKLMGVGYLDPSQNWKYEYLQSVKSSQGQIIDNSITYENIFTGTDVIWTYGNTGLKEEIIISNTTKTLLQDNPPSEYGLNNQDSYLVLITKLDYQGLDLYNTTGVLTGNFTTSDDQIDFKDIFGHIRCALPVGEAYELNNKSARQRLTYRILQHNGNFYLLSGLKVVDLNSMKFPVVIDPTLTLNSITADGHAEKEGSSYSTIQGASLGNPRTIETTFSIGQRYDPFGPPWFSYTIWRGFVYFDTMNIPSNSVIDSAVLSLYKDSDSSTTDFDIVVQNGQPTYPHDPLNPFDYNKSYYSGNGGSINTTSFSSGYNNITLANHSWINMSGRTKLCLRSSRDIDSVTPTGDEYVTVRSSDYPLAGYSPKLVVAYRNQSKIKNTGSTDISGYLLMQIHYYNSSQQIWDVDYTVIKESTPRIINSSEQLALDLIFNDLVNTWNLSNRNGTYRVYAAFRDPNGYVLRCDDDSYLEASYDFQVSFVSDSDSDGIADYLETTFFGTDMSSADTDLDTYSEPVDIDPLIDLKVTLTIKRIYASEYTYTWREAETWDTSETNCTGVSDGTEWINISDSKASGGYYTRQNDTIIQEGDESSQGFDDNANWTYTIQRSGVYYFWMRNYRDNNSSSNVRLVWKNDTGEYKIFDRKWDDGGLHYEVSWWANTTKEWKWSWYGLLELHEGDSGTLKLINLEEDHIEDYPDPSTRGDKGYLWMMVDKILITDDPRCHPNGIGGNSSNDDIIGTNSSELWDPSGQGPGGSAPDFYITTKIAGTSWTSYKFQDKFNIPEDLSTTVNVPDNVQNVPISIELWEEDGTTDTLCDISPNGKICNITYNLKNGTWWGDDQMLDTDFVGRTCGEVDGNYSSGLDANVIFSVSQNDKDSDGITYWQEMNVWKAGEPNSEPMDPEVPNNRYAVIVGAGASCKVRETSGNETCLLYEKGSNWDNYTLFVDLRSNDSSDDEEEIGVMFRYQDQNNYYILRWRNKAIGARMYLQKRVNGTLVTLDSKWVYLDKSEWYEFTIEVDGDDIQVSLDKWWFNNPILKCINDSSFSIGSIALFSSYNENAWFDDVVVIDNDDEMVLLDEGFDHGKFFYWTTIDKVPGNPSDWTITGRKADMEDFYITPDFVYRELNLLAHYDTSNIYYLSADTWRDADGDGTNDVRKPSTKPEVRDAIKYWLKDMSGTNDINLVYFFNHGGEDKVGNIVISSVAVDTNRDGDYNDGGERNIDPILESSDLILDLNMADWLPYYGSYEGELFDPIGRLTFIIEACYIGNFLPRTSRDFQNRNIIVSTNTRKPWPPHSAGGETGQDWPAFSFKLFKSMGDGITNLSTAFNAADKHVDKVNFLSVWGKLGGPEGDEGYPCDQDAKFDDNGDGKGSDYDLPKSTGNWRRVYKGSFRNKYWVSRNLRLFPSWGYDLFVNKVRIRFNVRRGLWPSVTAKLYEFDFRSGGSWISPTGYDDQYNVWDNEQYAYDNDKNTKASCTDDSSSGWTWTKYINLTLSEPIKCDKIRFYA